MRALIRAVAFVAGAGAVGAEPISGRQAAGIMFDADERAIQVSQSITPNQRRMVNALVPLIEKQINRTAQFYGSIAISPDEGFQSEASQSTFNYHTYQAADAAALAACNAKRKSGTSPCVLAGRILPEGWRSVPLSLSASATDAFERVYRRARAPKALAISTSTGAFGVGTPEGALATCRREAGRANDCKIVIRD